MKLITYKKIKYFQSDLFKKHNFIHAFFAKRHENNEPKELQIELNLDSNIHFLKQVHSNKVIQVNNKHYSKSKTGDCLTTKEENQSLWIYTADCIPLLIADKMTRSISACHCGINGLKKKIISKTLQELIQTGSNINNLIIAIGPSIAGDNYQLMISDIDDLVTQLTGKRCMENSSYLVECNKREIINLYRKDSRKDSLFFDIQAAAILQLYKEGIKQSQISINRVCTYSNPALFNSYRRDNTNQRQWSCIYS